MKTLYESILTGIEDTLKQGDEYIDQVTDNFKNLQKDLSIAKSYREVKTYNPGKFVINRYCKNVLTHLGFDAELIHIVIYLPGAYGASTLNDCKIVIRLMKYYNKSLTIQYKTDYTLPAKEYGSLNDVVKKFIKPNLKDVNTFKKLLENEIF
jgi:hypothetical protein